MRDRSNIYIQTRDYLKRLDPEETDAKVIANRARFVLATGLALQDHTGRLVFRLPPREVCR